MLLFIFYVQNKQKRNQRYIFDLMCLVDVHDGKLYLRCKQQQSVFLHDPLVDQLGHPVPDASAVFQCGPMDLPLVQATPANVPEELWSSRKENVVCHNHGTLPQQA